MMKKITSLYWVVLFLVLAGGFVYWQMSRLSNGIRTIQAESAKEVLVGALSAQVLAPGIDGNVPQPKGLEPLLDQYRKNPEVTHKRYLLVITWIHASRIFKAIVDKSILGGMVSSASVTGIPMEDRTDGWGNPYCIFADSKQMTFLSSGGTGVLNCEELRETAQQIAINANDSRLNREGGLLTAVYMRVRHTSSIPDQFGQLRPK